MYNSLWQTVLLAPLLVSAAPTLFGADVAVRNAPGAPDCGGMEKKYGWGTPDAPWRSSDTSGQQFFCGSGWNKGQAVIGVAAWKAKNAWGHCDARGPITNIQLRLANHEFIEIGAGGKECSAAAFGVDGGNLIDQQVEAWPSTDNPHAQGKTHLHVKQTNTDVWLKDDYTPKQGDPWTQGTGGGVLVAVTGYVKDGDVIQLNWHFLESAIKSQTQGPYQFDQAALNKAPIELSSEGAGSNCNPNDFNSTFTAAAKQGVFQTQTTTHQDSSSFSSETTVSAKIDIPELVEIGVSQTFKFGTDHMDQDQVAKQNQQMLEWTQGYPVPAQSILDCHMVTGKATLKGIKYTSSVKLTFEDGTTMDMPQSGTLDGQIFYGKFSGSCKARPIDKNSATDRDVCGL